MRNTPNVRELVSSIRNHRDVVRKEIYRAFYYLERGWMEISPEDQSTMSNFLKERREEQERERKQLWEEWP